MSTLQTMMAYGGHGPLDVEMLPAVPWMNHDVLVMTTVRETSRVALAGYLLRQHWANWRARAWQPIRDQFAALGRFASGLYTELRGQPEVAQEMAKATDRLALSQITLFRETLGASMLEQLGHTTVGAALYTGVLALFDVPHDWASATAWCRSCARAGGVTRELLVRLHGYEAPRPYELEVPEAAPLVWMLHYIIEKGGLPSKEPLIQTWARITQWVVQAYGIGGSDWRVQTAPRVPPSPTQRKRRQALKIVETSEALRDSPDMMMPGCVLLDVALLLPGEVLHNLDALGPLARRAAMGQS